MFGFWATGLGGGELVVRCGVVGFGGLCGEVWGLGCSGCAGSGLWAEGRFYCRRKFWFLTS
jgi:hypothetical protein